MKIRPTTYADLPVLLEIFTYGRQLQRLLGNHYQWKNGYPNQNVLEQDIWNGTSYVCVADETTDASLSPGTILGTFNIAEKDLPLFQTVYDGGWLNEAAYVTVQRMCTNGKVKGVSTFCMKWAISRFPNVKIYTHETNKPMTHIIEKCGFHFCGKIVPEDGEPRNAYQYAAKKYKEVMS